MTANSSLDRDLGQWLEAEAPARGPEGLHATVIDRARTTRQRPGWLVTLRGGTIGPQAGAVTRPAVRVGYVLVIVGLVLAALFAAFAAGAFRRGPSPLALEDLGSQGVLSSGVPYTSSLFEPRITFHLATRVDNLLDTVGPDPDWCPPAALGLPLPTSPRAIVLSHPRSCQDQLMILSPYAVDCGTADAHPDAATFAAALLANPGMTTAHDLGSLQTPGAVPARLFLNAYQGRVIRIDPSPDKAGSAVDPDHCRLLPAPDSADPTVVIRGDTPSMLVLVDVRGQLVVLLDTSSLQRFNGAKVDDPVTRQHLLNHIYDIAFD
jgi:hypothetical protein